MFSYAGNILRVDLTKQRLRMEPIPKKDLRKYLGGRGLAAKILFDELKPGIDPLSPENKLIFATGPLTGLTFPASAKYGVIAKSPLTGAWGEAYAGGFFGPELKHAGYDMVIFEGRAESPVFLWIHEGEAEIRDARYLWGKVTGEVQTAIRREVKDEHALVASIGPAGENLVRYATVMSDIIHALGRCGMGAVMGSKKLKAVAVRGSKKIRLYDEDAFKKHAKKAYKDLSDFRLTRGWGIPFTHGSSGNLAALNESGRLPTQNFRRATFEGAQKITGETMTKEILIGRESCYACGHGCKRVTQAKEPYDVDPSYGGPEYESMAALGSFCMNDNLVSIAKANELCNKYGLDTISTGVNIAFAMECHEKGLIKKEQTEGLDLSWGNDRTIVSLIVKIAHREGLGDLLAEGVKKASEKIGGEAPKYAMHVKGLELPMHEPRGKKGVGLSYATTPKGGDQTEEFHDDSYEDDRNMAPEIGLVPTLIRNRFHTGPDKARCVIIGQNWWSLYHTLVLCLWGHYPMGSSINNLISAVSSATGWEVTPSELIEVGERVWNLCRVFNIREGMTRKDDTLPERFTEQLTNGVCRGESISKEVLQKLLDYYFEFRGWDVETGIPTREKLEELDLGYAADELQRLGKL